MSLEPDAHRVPGAEEAEAAEEKFLDYLLNPHHPHGRGKARFFATLGFDQSNWEDLRIAMVSTLPTVAGVYVKPNGAGGQNWEARMTIQGQLGTADVRTVWAVNPGAGTKLVTAYPLE